jgi:hypothetical protein
MGGEKNLLRFIRRTLVWGGLAAALAARGQEAAGRAPFEGHPPIYGALTCSTSACHGGADEKSRQYVIWSQRDVHSRAFATLGTARAARMAEALQIKDPLTSPRCTSCHAPLQMVAPGLISPEARVSEGVSCVTCHGPLEGWLRSHTRPDYTHADRVAAGMRDLRDLSARANACVACHQNIEPDLVNVGKHPALIFELDGQTQSQPKHWREPEGRTGAQAWFVGQATAWRELSWSLQHGKADPARDLPRWQALRWLLQRTGLDFEVVALAQLSADTVPAALGRAQETAGELALRAAQTWAPAQTASALARLAGTAADFQGAEPALTHACRAERLVLALDRLLAALPADRRPAEASAQLDKLFALAQSIPDFSPKDFSRELALFAQRVAAVGR